MIESPIKKIFFTDLWEDDFSQFHLLKRENLGNTGQEAESEGPKVSPEKWSQLGPEVMESRRSAEERPVGLYEDPSMPS